MKAPVTRAPDFSCSNQLCLECALCCSGVIFADVRLQHGDDSARLRSLGLQLSASNERSRSKATSESKDFKFTQPCAALDGCRCRIYPNHPVYCRKFECLLLQDVKANRVQSVAALDIIHRARSRVEEVKQLLRALGDTDEKSPLAARFHQTGERLETLGLDAEARNTYGQLTLAFHDLNLLISESFYR